MTDDDVIQATPELAGLYASKERNYHTELELKLGRKEGTNNADKAEFWAKAKSEIGPRILKRLTIEHRAEKLANTIYKDAFKELNEAPFNSGDRAFMIDTAVATQKLLKAGGLDLSVADIQAALWYYEKRLYASLGKIEKASKGGISDLGYEEAIRTRPTLIDPADPLHGSIDSLSPKQKSELIKDLTRPTTSYETSPRLLRRPPKG
jgi:hypothetical protein